MATRFYTRRRTKWSANRVSDAGVKHRGQLVRTPMGDPLVAYFAADSLSTNNIAIIKTPC